MNRKDIIAVIGYGSQGRAIARNLNDSGFRVIVGLRKKNASYAKAKRDGIKTAMIPIAVREAKYIIIAIPDHTHASVLNPTFFETIRTKPALIFLHGSSIHFHQVCPPKDWPVYLLAPHAPGVAVRENYENKKPFSAFYAVYQGAKKVGYASLITLAKAIGIPKSCLIKTNFGDEAVGDLFGEQAVLCGGLARLLKYGFETLVEGGLPKENAYLEVAFQLDLIVSLIKKHGLDGMFKRISPIARYGSIINGPRIIAPSVKKEMKKVLKEIAAGRFVKTAEKTDLAITSKQYDKVTNRDFDKQVKKFASD